MNSPARKAERKAEKQAQFEKECEERRQEEYRKQCLSMYMRIEETAIDEDLKYILHKITERLGMED